MPAVLHRPRPFVASFCGAALWCAAVTSGCARPDDQIASDARTQLAADPSLKGASVSVVVKKGVVLLRGHAVSSEQPRDAIALVARVEGVRTVIDQLTLSDAGIRDALAHAFGQDPLLAGVPIEVTVADGVVTLASSATGADQRTRAVAITRAVPGVVGVEDKMK
jgi:osmotically-inducible protein OsmY